MKQIFFYLVFFMLGACASSPDNANICPPISISRETSRTYQSDGISDKFQINLIGYESYCYTEPANNRRYAVITPLFKVRRLESSSVTSLDVNFYVKTSINAEDYLGIRKFNQVLNISQADKEAIITGRQTKTRISQPPYSGFDISLGLALTEAEAQKAKQMLDIDYRYLSEEELSDISNISVDTRYLEISPDEKVIYSDTTKSPAVVKKDASACNGCN